MIPKIPADPAERAERKANLLLASALLRGQAAVAVDELAGRADGWAVRLMAWRNLLSNPIVLARVLNRANLDGLGGDDVYWQSERMKRLDAADH